MVDSRRRGKALEKAVAKRLNGRRIGPTGLATPDVEAGRWSIECKSRVAIPSLVREAMAQACRNAKAGQTPIAILHQTGERHDGDIVCVRFSDFEQWHGELRVDSVAECVDTFAPSPGSERASP